MLVHVNDSGIPEYCPHKIGECPFGMMDSHFITGDEALTNYKKKISENSAQTECLDVIDTPSSGDTIRVIALKLSSKYPGTELFLSGDKETYVTVDHIAAPVNKRGQGIGSQLMRELVDLADQNGWALALSPSDSFGCSLPRLKKFYEKFGFVNNSGANKDFSVVQTMIRPAVK